MDWADPPVVSLWIDRFLASEQLPDSYREVIATLHVPLADRIAEQAVRAPERMLTVGLCGPQGSGKSTLAESLRMLLTERELPVAVLSLDDLCLTRAERIDLSRRVHSLFVTRGVPGTHDVRLGMRVLDALRRGDPGVSIPSFDKAQDDRLPEREWRLVRGSIRVLLFEGWCVGATAESDEALIAPVNALERDEDSERVWRRHVNNALALEYRQLFSSIDLLILLRVPSFEAVLAGRLEQERKLRARIAATGDSLGRTMDEAELGRFISHYERVTNHILREMPSRADVVIDVRGNCVDAAASRVPGK